MRTRKKLILLCIMGIIFLNTVPLKADLIVDTSSGLTTGGDVSGIYLAKGQWLAEKIFLPQAYTITQVQGIIGAILSWGGRQYDGDIRAAIRSDIGAIPGNILFSQIFTSSTPGIKTWQGPTSLSWTLSAGTYWLAFEVESSSTFLGVMESNPTIAGIGPDPMPDPLHFYGSAATDGIGTSYHENGLFNIAIKVYGDLCPGDNPIMDPPPPYIPIVDFAPLPSAIILLGTGLGCLAIYRRRKRTADN
jgi:hypothetical protein